MNPKTRSLLCKTIIISASICLVAFIAFKFFRTGVQEMVDSEEIVESSSPAMPTDEELHKMSSEIDDFRTNMTQEQRDEFNRETEELAKMMENMPHEGEHPLTWSWGPAEDRRLETWWQNKSEEERKNHKFASDIEQAIRENNESLENIKKTAQEQAKKIDVPLAKKREPKKQETKKPEQKKSATPKAPEKKQSGVKPQEPQGKKAQPMTPSKTTGPATREKPTIVAPAKAEPVKPATPKEVAKPMVTVKNNIRKDMTGYKKFGKNWYPDEYSVTINGIQIEEGEQIAVPAGDSSVCNVVFAYDFRPTGKSYKKGVEEVSYVLKPGTKELDITFSWYKTPCIIVNPVMSAGVANNNQGGRQVQGA